MNSSMRGSVGGVFPAMWLTTRKLWVSVALAMNQIRSRPEQRKMSFHPHRQLRTEGILIYQMTTFAKRKNQRNVISLPKLHLAIDKRLLGSHFASDSMPVLVPGV